MQDIESWRVREEEETGLTRAGEEEKGIDEGHSDTGLGVAVQLRCVSERCQTGARYASERCQTPGLLVTVELVEHAAISKLHHHQAQMSDGNTAMSDGCRKDVRYLRHHQADTVHVAVKDHERAGAVCDPSAHGRWRSPLSVLHGTSRVE